MTWDTGIDRTWTFLRGICAEYFVLKGNQNGGTNGSSIRRDWKSKPWGVLVGVVCIVHYILYSCCVFVYHRMVYCVLLCLRIIPVVDCVNTTPGSSVGWPDLGKWSSGRVLNPHDYHALTKYNNTTLILNTLDYHALTIYNNTTLIVLKWFWIAMITMNWHYITTPQWAEITRFMMNLLKGLEETQSRKWR